ncbi:MAG: DUF167 domain-containing protein [Kiritimatiellia bacterium]
MPSQVIHVKTVTRARHKHVVKDNGNYKIYVTAVPAKGKANKMLIEVLADYFNCRKSDVRIIRGETSKDKLVEIKS